MMPCPAKINNPPSLQLSNEKRGNDVRQSTVARFPDFPSCSTGTRQHWCKMLALLNVSAHLIWISAGELITKLVAKRSNQKLQAYVYFLSLLTVAGWLCMANPYWNQ
ncbi:hypothetical protein [Shewanella salipaludis]|uniref:Uncharacterized protein n=1 Tax=Shewanella salipaludis TaxID=2723052 RepID=A0A972FUQ9_9GAMM|nr:hypothetical protein [Shewanella salipaludis]NMH66131.1 hypothetical protein [Shewanella salipaludis]